MSNETEPVAESTGLRRLREGPEPSPADELSPDDEVPWIAQVASLGVSTADGRVLDPDGLWALACRTVPLFVVADTGLLPVGTVTAAVKCNGNLLATGTADPVKVGEAVACHAGGLFPQIGLAGGDATFAFDDRPYLRRLIRWRPPLLRIRNSRIAYIALGPTPAFAGTWLRWASWGPVEEEGGG